MIAPAAASPDVIPAALNPVNPNPYRAPHAPTHPIPAPNAPHKTSGIALFCITRFLSFNASPASLTYLAKSKKILTI